MAQHYQNLNLYVLDATDVDPFQVPESAGAASVIGDALDNTIWGNSSPNSIEGGEGNDILKGYGGNDSLKGGDGTDYLYGDLGNDTYYVDDQSDIVLEPSNGGLDLIIASVSYAIQDFDVEDLLLTGTADISGEGNEGNNQITGNDGDNLLVGYEGSDTLNGALGNDVLDGGPGADTLAGGQEDDTYYIDDVGDLVIEEGSGGYDTIVTSIHANLQNYSHVEVLKAEDGSGNLNLTGGNLNDTLLGNLGRNVLNGGGGADTLRGGDGEDVYYIDAEGDTIIETQLGVKDTVYTSISYALGENLEVLDVTSGNKDLVLIGNSLDNFIYANAGANTIDGGAGGDIMVGGAGNDTYYIDNANDMIAEFSGIDTVITQVSFRMEDQEILKAIGSSPVSLTGDALANTITGNIGKNTIKGGGGNDRLNGGYGNDVLYGGTGRDVFTFRDKLSKTGNLDRIVDYRVADDTIYLENSIFRKLTKTGILSGTNFVLGSKAKDKNDYVLYDKVKGYLYYDADGSGKGAAVAFAKLAAGLKMAASEFKVI
jgi:serralysin